MSISDKSGPCIVPEYALTGPQVEPAASFWNHCPRLRMVSIDELTAITDNPAAPGYFPEYPDPCTAEGRAEIEREMQELLDLQAVRDDPDALQGGAGGDVLTSSPCVPLTQLPRAFGYRAPASRLLDLQPRALGAVQVDRLPGQQVIRTGRGMARAVEAETPGLFHRHALNYLITTRSWSPPRQALIWTALDVAIASAMQAAWYYKWLSPRPLTSRRERPAEYAERNADQDKVRLTVLYDGPDELNPNQNRCKDLLNPGTPRHPAYPSGHSTYAGAATTILAYFFGNDCMPRALTLGREKVRIGDELRNMADNIGMGRLWAGIHWRSDHEAGLKLGQVVGCLVLRQMAAICGDDFTLCPGQPNCDMKDPPSLAKLEEQAMRCREACAAKDEGSVTLGEPCKADPKTCEDDVSPEQLDKRSVQQGAR